MRATACGRWQRSLEWAPKIRGVRESLELALARMLASMDPVEVADSPWAVAKLAWKPSEGRLREILEPTLQRVLPSLGELDFERSAWALRKLDWQPVSVGLRSLLTESDATPSLRGGCDGEPVSSSDLEPRTSKTRQEPTLNTRPMGIVRYASIHWMVPQAESVR